MAEKLVFMDATDVQTAFLLLRAFIGYTDTSSRTDSALSRSGSSWNSSLDLIETCGLWAADREGMGVAYHEIPELADGLAGPVGRVFDHPVVFREHARLRAVRRLSRWRTATDSILDLPFIRRDPVSAELVQLALLVLGFLAVQRVLLG